MNSESFTAPLNKQAWKTIAVAINTHGYNLTADNCYIKWTAMKKKYKMLRDANNRTGAGKQTWEYFDVIHDMLRKNPEIMPLSIASNIRGFEINVNAFNTSESINTNTNWNNNNKHAEEKENELNIEATDIVLKNRPKKSRKRKTSTWIADLTEQKERHHHENYEQRERFLSLLEKHLKK